MSSDKSSIKRDLREQQLQNVDDVKMMRQGFAKSLRALRENFEANHKQLLEQYEQQVEDLKVDLELRRKVEIHEIEERKNRHINELLFNHQEAFDEIKAYYNDITRDNLQLIKNLRDEIADMRDREKKNQKKMQVLTQENKDLSEELSKKLEEQQQLEERTSEAKQEYRFTEEKYRKIEKERDDLYRRFQKAVREIARKAELGKNAVLEKKLEQLTAHFDEKQ